jgi:hypothetical protein
MEVDFHPRKLFKTDQTTLTVFQDCSLGSPKTIVASVY